MTRERIRMIPGGVIREHFQKKKKKVEFEVGLHGWKPLKRLKWGRKQRAFKIKKNTW